MSSVSIKNAEPDTLRQLLLLELGSGLYAVDSTAVREILPTAPVTRLPGAPAHVRGLMNLRGQLVTVVDLGDRLGVGSVRNAEGSTVVVQSGEQMLGVRVDEVRDVQLIEMGGTAELPYQRSAQGLIGGLGRLGDEVVLVVDVDEIVRQTLA